jgi:hypothetical protein
MLPPLINYFKLPMKSTSRRLDVIEILSALNAAPGSARINQLALKLMNAACWCE